MAEKNSRPISEGDLRRTVARLRGLRCQWWVAGGWSIDLFLGRQTRSHGDLEIGVWREDQSAVREIFPSAEWTKAVEGQWLPWNDEQINLPRFQLKVRDPTSGSEVEFFLNDHDDERNFVCRRAARIRMPIAETIITTSGTIPILSPAMQLLYKAKHTRPKDEADFALILPLLSAEQRIWLHSGISILHPDHAWLKSLTRADGGA